MGPRVLKDTSQSNEDALKARIAELEQALISGNKPTVISVRPNPKANNKMFLHFDGNFYPFSLSQEKAKRLRDAMEEIDYFADHGKLPNK